jgi:hypothetical protein
MNDSITARPLLPVSLDRGLIYHPDSSRNENMVRTEKTSSALLIVAFWMIVMLPLGWGVVQSVVKSLPLFQVPSVTPLPPAPGP